jgi:hypothetical protein
MDPLETLINPYDPVPPMASPIFITTVFFLYVAYVAIMINCAKRRYAVLTI